MSYDDAIRTLPDGITIDVDINPNSKFFQIQAYNPWRRRIEIRISAPARKGLANEELAHELSLLFNVPLKDVVIISGNTSSKKTIKIHNVSSDKVLNTLQEILTNGQG